MEKIINSSNILDYTVSERDIISPHDYQRILENITDENNLLELLELPNGINKIFKYVKYYCNPIYYLHNITITEHQNNIKDLLQDLKQDLKEIDINHIKFYCWLYNISYLDCNKKDFLLQYYNIISAKLPIIPFKNKKKTKNNKIKLGIVGFTINREDSDTFSLHSVYRDRAEILKKMDSTLFEKYLIVKEEHGKEYITKSGNLGILLQEFYNKMDHIISIHNYDINSIKSLIDLDLDILLYPDIGMNPFTNTMGNYRIAPIQINTWGHSVTSGLVNMDYYISSKYYEVDDLTKAQEYYSEKLIAMDSLSTYYRCYNLTDPYSREQLNIPNNRQILFCIQNMRKLNLDFFNLLKTIIELKPNIIILLRKHFLKKNNIDDIYKLTNGKNNILFIDDCSTYLYHCYIYHSTLVLDTYPFGGCNSSLEAFSLGKIVITRPAEYLAGRFTYGFYKKMDIMDAVVDNFEEYIDKVIYYLDNTTHRKKLEQRISENKHLLFNDIESVKEWEQTLIELSKPYVELIEEPKYKFTRVVSSNSIIILEDKLLSLKDSCNKILEIGSYDGRSTTWFLNNIMDNKYSKLYCIDPFITTDYKDNFLYNISISQNNTKINIIEESYLKGLSQLLLENKLFNIIHIDGVHYSKNMNDYLSIAWNLLTINGLLILDNYSSPGFKNMDRNLLPIKTIEYFLNIIIDEYETIYSGNQLIIKKTYTKTQNDYLNDIGLKQDSIVEKLKYNNLELLKKIIPRNKPIAHCYYEESFNFGDSAIWSGQEKLLELLNIEPVYVCNDKNYDSIEMSNKLGDDGIILFRGGGNFGDLYIYHNLRLQILKNHTTNTFIQLPQSVKFNNDDNITKTANIIKLVKKVILLARDENTYNFFLKHFYFDNVEIYLCCDMAFNLGEIKTSIKPIFKSFILKRTDQETDYPFNDIVHDVLGNVVIPLNYQYKYNDQLLLSVVIYTNKDKDIGITDWYLTKNKNPQIYDSLSYSQKSQIGLAMACNILSLGERVITDRLHAFILSLQLNKPHTIINNNNGKLFSFYNTWCKKSTITHLDSKFDNIITHLDSKMILNQRRNDTSYNRYPEIFSEVKEYINKPKTILSFGCSKGIECNTLHEIYYPDSEIIGLDINETIIKENVKKNKYENVKYYNNINDITLKYDGFDLIFVMSVLCRWPETEGNYILHTFTDTLNQIDELLNPGGYLCIYNSKYLFTDTLLFNEKYDKINTRYKDSGFVYKYNNDNTRIYDNYPYFLFKKKYLEQKKYVLYKQINGFNDMFCQLVKCYAYCKKNNRLLLIDNGNHAQSMNLDFNKYFHFNTDTIITNKDKINSILKQNKLTILNNFQDYLTNDYSTYWNGMDQYGEILCDSKTGLELRFDFNKIYDEDILLYFQGGSDYNGGLLFTILRLKNDIMDIIRTKYLSIKKPYISIYVRNTDQQTDYKELYNKNKQFIDDINNNIYLATDSKDVVDFFKSKNNNISNFTTFPENEYDNLHNSNIDEYTKIINALTDLIILSLSDEIITNSDNSGFYQLAYFLFTNKYNDSLLGGFLKSLLPQKHFICFANKDSIYYNGGKMLIKQVQDTKLFDNMTLFSTDYLKNQKDFWDKHHTFIENNKRGYGYYIWKPYIIKKSLEKLNNGDILLYLDSGCEVDTNKLDILEEYFNIVKKDLIIGSFPKSTNKNDYWYPLEKKWNKMDLIKYLDIEQDEYLNTIQRQTGLVMYYVCDEIIKFVDEWYNIACNYHLIDDSKSIEPNLSCFVEHRHDQSIFSLLTKKYNIFSDRVLTDCFISQGSKYKDMYSGKYISNKMKLDCVLTAVNENELYLDFIPIFIKTWNKLYPDVDVKIILIAKIIPENLLLYKNNIIIFEPIENVLTSFTSQFIRLLYPCILNYKNGVLITDMDMLPMNSNYYTKNILEFDNNKFIYYRDNVLFNHKQIAMCYNIATPQIWKDIFKVNSIDDIRSIIKNVSNKNIIKDGHGNTGWDIDQKELYEMVYNWNTKTNNLVCLDEKHTGFSRLDRITNFDINNLTIRKNIMKGKYTDYHCYRPMSKYAEINWEIYNLLSHTPINISNTSLSASTTIGT